MTDGAKRRPSRAPECEQFKSAAKGRSSDGAKGGVSLAETLVVVVITCMLLIVVYKLLMSGLGRGDEMTEEHKLMVDVRNLLENLSRDMSAAHVILPPASGEELKSNLNIARYSSDDVTPRLTANQSNPDYPFFKVGSETPVLTPVRRVRYLFDQGKRLVTRIEEAGILTGKGKSGGAAGNDLRLISEYTFKNDASGSPGFADSTRAIANNVVQFELAYLDYDEKGQARLLTKAEEIYRTSCVGLLIRAAQTSGVYAREAGKTPSRRQPIVEMATKFWTARKLSENAYPEYFSSADDDLRY